jgi:cardiolipin synthase
MQMRSSGYLLHNRVRLVKGGREYFALLARMIQEAQHSIHFQIYIFDDDETGRSIAQALKEAARRKVQVFLLLDGYASQNLSDELIEELKEAGVRFLWFEQLLKSRHFYFGRRLHHKVVVTDAARALVGGMNISNRYNDTAQNTAWLDWALYVEGEVAAALDKECRSRARLRERKSNKKNNHPPATASVDEECPVRIRVNDWVHRKMQISKSYLEMFRDSSSHIIMMSSYFMPGQTFRRRMREAAHRGVKIQVILAGLSDIPIVKYAERFVYRWLLRNNIEIYEYQRNVLHGKIATYDGKWMTAGSYNINNLSAFASIELNLDVNDKRFARHVEQRLRMIIKTDCIRITEDVYNAHHSGLQRIVQRISYDAVRLFFFVFTFYFKQRE